MMGLNLDSPSVQSHLTILQSVISRTAANSSSSKAWCVALVSAVLVIVADKQQPDLVWIGIVPVVLFLFLDAYYLGLERRFRDAYNTFIRKLHANEATVEDVFIVDPGGDFSVTTASTLRAFASMSVWPFYLTLVLMLAVVRYLII